MEVVCPGCHSRFLLPQGVRAGTRLRCSVCRTEFPCPDFGEEKPGRTAARLTQDEPERTPVEPAAESGGSAQADRTAPAEEPRAGEREPAAEKDEAPVAASGSGKAEEPVSAPENAPAGEEETPEGATGSGKAEEPLSAPEKTSAGDESAGTPAPAPGSGGTGEGPVRETVSADEPEPLSFSARRVTERGLPEFEQPRRSHGCLLWLVLLLLCVAGAAVAWHTVPEFKTWVQGLTGQLQGPQSSSQVASPQTQPKTSSDPLVLVGTRQTLTKNSEGTTVIVVSGSVANQDSVPYGAVQLEGALLDREGKPLVSRLQRAGQRLTKTQVELLSEKEMTAILNDAKEIEAAFPRLLPRTSMPFMFVFVDPPQGIASYSVKVCPSERLTDMTEPSQTLPAAQPKPAEPLPAAPAAPAAPGQPAEAAPAQNI